MLVDLTEKEVKSLGFDRFIRRKSINISLWASGVVSFLSIFSYGYLVSANPDNLVSLLCLVPLIGVLGWVAVIRVKAVRLGKELLEEAGSAKDK